MSAANWRANDVPTRDPLACSAVLDGEAVLYHPTSARSLLLNSSLAAVWTLVDGVADVARISARIAEMYDVSEQQVRDDVTDGLCLLEGEGFLGRG